MTTPGLAAGGTARDARADKVHHAAAEFESMLVKQLLKAARVGGAAGSEKTSAYGDMAVDALASAVERGGGLGLARRIEQTLCPHSGSGAGHAPAAAAAARDPKP
ncbi:MAG TPA: hypothetical protein VE987_07115 [Polyangiaceae bacterium]|nr:hypothetical protein [Polyangiaceae bacterium]